MGMAGEPKAFPFRGIERLENSPVDCFQRDGAGRPAVGGPLAKRPAGRMRSFPSHIASHDAVCCGTDPIKMGIHIVIAEAKHL